MGFYAAPLYNLAGASLPSGYTPPAGIGVSAVVSSAGLFAYRPSLYNAVHANLVGGYTPPAGKSNNVVLARALAGSAQSMSVGSWESKAIGAPTIFLWRRYLVAESIAQSAATSIHVVRNAAEKVFPWESTARNVSGALLRSGYSIPPATYQGATLSGYNNQLSVGRATVELARRAVLPASVGNASIVSEGAELRNLNRYIRFAGAIAPSALGLANVASTRRPVFAVGVSTAIFGAVSIWNLRRYIPIAGHQATMWGQPCVQGGVKYVMPGGLVSLVFGAATVVNTRANQYAAGAGAIPSGEFGAVNVSPRMLRPSGIFGTTFGFPVVQFPPQPVGWLASAFGYPVVEYKTKIAQPAGMAAAPMGFPVVRDRAQRVLHKSQLATSLFGDVQLRLVNQRVRVPGWDSQGVSEWGEILSTRRFVVVPGAVLGAIGAANVRNKSPSIAPAGLVSLAFGLAGVGWRVRTVAPGGITLPFPQLPAPVLWQTPSLRPPGIAAPIVPLPTVWPRVREVVGAGWDAQRLGTARVDFAYRRIRAEGYGLLGTSYGQHRVEHQSRVLKPAGAEFMAFGAAWVSYGEQLVAPLGISEPLLHLHMVGRHQFVGPEGFEATRWLTRILPESREVYPKTFGASYGWPTVSNRTRYLPPGGITTYPEPSMHWGIARVWNRRQYIQQVEDQQSDLAPPAWPLWTLVENRNRLVRVFGYVATRFGAASIDNRARPIYPTGMGYPVLPEYQKTGAVTYRVRPLPLEGIEPPLMAQWAVVHNKAIPLKPAGIAAGRYGVAQVLNLRRFYRLQGFEPTVFGYPMVAPAIREITFESRYGIAPQRIELPRVFLKSRYVEAPSIINSKYESKMGTPDAIIYFRRIITRWTLRDVFGDPFIWNKTPELRVRGRPSDDWGDTQVRLQWRPVKPEGAVMTLLGITRIADRRQRVVVPGRNFMLVSDKLTVRRIGADPVATQYIDLRKFVITQTGDQAEADSGYGIATTWPDVGGPDLLKGYIFHGKPFASEDMLLMGNPYVTAYSIRVEPGYWDLLVGEPFVSLKRRTLLPESIGQLVKDGGTSGTMTTASMGSWGKPSLSHHTIYAVLEAPEQAMRNHGTYRGQLTPVNAGARTGQPTVTKWNNAISVNGIAGNGALGSWGFWGVGMPTLYNKRQTIQVIGTYMGRMGWVTIPGPQTIRQEDSILSLQWGGITVSRPPYRGPMYLSSVTAGAGGMGAHMVDFYHRRLHPRGFLSQGLGGPDPFASTNMPNSLTVGPPNLHPQVGFAATTYGDAWVSLRVRGVTAQGFESFLSEYDYQNFKQRMRVRRAEKPVVRLSLAPSGLESAWVGTPGVRPGVHFIRPDGNSDQFRKGAF